MNDDKTPASVSIPVIQFVDREIEKERLLTVEKMERLREVLEARFASVAKAQELAYIELQRRLDMLNHAHEEMTRDKAHFQPRELADVNLKEYSLWRNGVDKWINEQRGKIATWGTVLFLVIVAINVLLRMWK